MVALQRFVTNQLLFSCIECPVHATSRSIKVSPYPSSADDQPQLTAPRASIITLLIRFLLIPVCAILGQAVAVARTIVTRVPPSTIPNQFLWFWPAATGASLAILLMVARQMFSSVEA